MSRHGGNTSRKQSGPKRPGRKGSGKSGRQMTPKKAARVEAHRVRQAARRANANATTTPGLA